jgi:hypothetical protein
VPEGNSINCERLTPETLSAVVVAQLLKLNVSAASTAMVSFFMALFPLWQIIGFNASMINWLNKI